MVTKELYQHHHAEAGDNAQKLLQGSVAGEEVMHQPGEGQAHPCFSLSGAPQT